MDGLTAHFNSKAQGSKVGSKIPNSAAIMAVNEERSSINSFQNIMRTKSQHDKSDRSGSNERRSNDLNRRSSLRAMSQLGSHSTTNNIGVRSSSQNNISRHSQKIMAELNGLTWTPPSKAKKVSTKVPTQWWKAQIQMDRVLFQFSWKTCMTE